MNNKLILYNGNIVTETQVLKNYSIVIKDGLINDIIPNTGIKKYDVEQYFDCTGKYIMPGLIDVHADSIEKIIVPRKGLKFDLEMALLEMDRQLSQQGITTIYHSLTMARTTICNNLRTITPEDIFKMCDLIAQHNNQLLVNHRIHIRLELNTIDVYNDIIEYLNKGLIHELSFMDHSPGQGQYKNIVEFRKVIKQQYGEISIDQQNEIIKICIEKRKLGIYKLENLIGISAKMKIPLAYHDVESTQQIDWMINNGMQICEFPLREEIAKYATNNGLFCVVGAPNVIKEKSYYNNASALELFSKGYANVLCSDYFTPLLLQAVFKLNRKLAIPINIAVNTASLNPAIAMGISGEYGSISKNKRADIIVVNFNDSIPKVEITIVDGIIKSIING